MSIRIGLQLSSITVRVAAAQSMKDFFSTRKDALLTEIRTKAALDKDLEAKLQSATEEWKGSFNA